MSALSVPETRYARTTDGFDIAYQTLGEGSISSKAGPSEVLVSQTVTGLVAGSDIAFEDAGEHVLKGVPGEWRLFRVVSS
jgi:hypothetical protein